MRNFFTLVIALLVTAPVVARAQAPHQDLAAAGWQALQANDGEQARHLFDTALATQPRDAVLHLGAGAAAHMLGDDDQAMRALRAALSFDPTLVVASRLLAEIAWQRGDLTLAIETYRAALVYAPDNTEISSRLDRLQGESARRASAAQLTVSVIGRPDAAVTDRATRVLNTAYWQIAKLVGAYPSDVIAVELDTTRPFQPTADRRRGAATAGPDAPLGSTADLDAPLRSMVNLDAPLRISADGALADAEAFDRVLTTSLVQTMVLHMAPTGVPAWFTRGLAQVVNTADVTLARQRLRALGDLPWSRLDIAAPATGSPASVLTGAGSAVTDGDQPDVDASLLIVRALLARIGPRSTQLLDELADGRSLDAALSQFGFSWADLKADVVRSLEQ